MTPRTPHIALILLLGLLVSGQATPPPASVDPALRSILSLSAQEVQGLHPTAAVPGALPRLVLQSLPVEAPGFVDVFVEPRSELIVGVDESLIPLSGNMYAARIPVTRLREWLNQGAVERVRLSRPVQPTLDRSVKYVGGNQVRTLDEQGELHGLTGAGVILGIVDSGLDLTHPDFVTRDNRTRLQNYWDQRSFAGRPTKGLPFGEQWNGNQIDTQGVTGLDLSGHGTHVLGIAAGNGRAGWQRGRGDSFVGMAPESKLVAVRSNLTEYGVAVGVQYIFARATELGLPAVINLSLGNHFGPHAGETAFERALEGMVGPGRIIVAAAGNDAHRDMHSRLDLAPGAQDRIDFRFPRYARDGDFFAFNDMEGWFPWKDTYRFTIMDPEGTEILVIEKGTERQYAGKRGIVKSWYLEDGGWGSFLLEIEDNPASSRQSIGLWGVRVECLDRPSGEPIDFWVVNWRSNGEDLPRFESHVDPAGTVIVPATARRILAAGAISTRACWTDVLDADHCYSTNPEVGDVAFFSSYGPTRDGRKKPELLAPGFGVVSCRSSSIDPAFWKSDELDELSVPGGAYWLNQGTSMSAPHVSGAVALLLQQFPHATPEQVSSRLVALGRPVVDTRSGNPEVVLDVAGALRPAVTLTSSEAIREADGIHVRWAVEAEQFAVTYRVMRQFDEGPEHELQARRLTGSNPYEIVDGTPEAGKVHRYRIVAEDERGLRETLTTLTATLPGTPTAVFRAPDPNPARSQVNLRFAFPPTPAGGNYTVDVIGVNGRHLRRVEQGSFGPEGQDLLTRWNLDDDSQRRVASGIYFARVSYTLHRSAPGVSPDAFADLPTGTQTLVRRVVTLP